MKKIKISIIILNYNTKKLTLNCVNSILKNCPNLNYEIFVVDNGSNDGSIEVIKKLAKNSMVEAIYNKKNLGFAKGNNSARELVSGEYVLFLNSDTEVKKYTVEKCLDYFKSDKDIGALTCKIVLPGGSLDKDARRSFPTPWVSFAHFSGLDRIFPKSRLFARYWYGYLDSSKIHEVDVLQGAFFLTKKKILDQVGWFDEDYFLDGEDIDLSWKIKKAGFKIMYYPEVSIIHLKKASKKRSNSLHSVTQGVRSMEIFYRKRMWKEYPLVVNYIVIFGINLVKLSRGVKKKLT